MLHAEKREEDKSCVCVRERGRGKAKQKVLERGGKREWVCGKPSVN
jgi:hypothetical protein